MPNTVTNQSKTFKDIIHRVESALSNDKRFFESFFEGLSLISMDDETICILAGSSLVQTYLLKDTPHSQLLKQCIREVTGKDYKIKILLKDEIETSSHKEDVITHSESTSSHTYFSNCLLNKKYTFDNFVIGDCNSDAVRAALMVSNAPGTSFNPLFIYSKSGLGKTHLLHAIGNYYQEKHPESRVVYITTDAFVDEYVKYTSGSQGKESLRDFFKGVDILLVDDVQFLSDKVKTSEMFFNIFNILVNNGKQIVLTADRHPKDLRGLEDRLVSRFNMGLSVNISTPDTQTLLEILKRKLVSHGLDLSNYDPEGLEFLAETFSKNVRELEGAVNRLIFHTVSVNDKVSLKDIKDAVNIMMPTPDKNIQISEDDIINAVGKYYTISYEQIKSDSRIAQIALARRISMYLCRVMLGDSYPKIGDVFQRDHSTVMTAVDKITKEIKTDYQLSTAVTEIKKSLKK